MSPTSLLVPPHRALRRRLTGRQAQLACDSRGGAIPRRASGCLPGCAKRPVSALRGRAAYACCLSTKRRRQPRSPCMLLVTESLLSLLPRPPPPRTPPSSPTTSPSAPCTHICYTPTSLSPQLLQAIQWWREGGDGSIFGETKNLPFGLVGLAPLKYDNDLALLKNSERWKGGIRKGATDSFRLQTIRSSRLIRECDE